MAQERRERQDNGYFFSGYIPCPGLSEGLQIKSTGLLQCVLRDRLFSCLPGFQRIRVGWYKWGDWCRKVDSHYLLWCRDRVYLYLSLTFMILCGGFTRWMERHAGIRCRHQQDGSPAGMHGQLHGHRSQER